MASYGRSLVDVGIALTLQDRFSNPANRALSNWRSLINDMQTFSQGMSMGYSKIFDTSLDTTKNLYRAFEYSAKVQKNTFLTNKMINDGSDHQADLLKQAQDINLKNPLKAMDITSGQKFMAMAGMGYEQISKATEPAAQLAAIFDMEMGGKGGTADLMTNIMATFQKAPDQAREVANQLAVATTSANMSLPDLAQSIKYVGTNAKIAGLDINEVAAAIGVLGDRGIQGSMAGTNLGQALTSLNKSITGVKKSGLKTLKSIGLDPKDLQDSRGNLISIQQVIKKIALATQGLGSVAKQSVFFELFGQRGMRTMFPLIEDALGPNKFQEILDKVNASNQGKGWLGTTISDYMKSPEGRIDAMTSAWENFTVTVGASISTVVMPFLRTFTDMAKGIYRFINTPFGSVMAKIFAGASVFTTITTGVYLMGTTLKFALGMLSTSKVSTQGMATNIGKAKMEAGMLQGYMSNIARLSGIAALNTQRMAAGMVGGSVAGGATAATNSIKLNNGFTMQQTKNGRIVYRDHSGRFTTQNKAMAGGGALIMSNTTAGNNTATTVGNTIRNSGNGIMGGIRSMGSKLSGFLMRGLNFLGPIAMVAGILGTFVPMIYDWLVDEDDDAEDSAAASRQQRENRLNQIIQGRPTQVNLNLNGVRFASATAPGGSDMQEDFNMYNMYGEE